MPDQSRPDIATIRRDGTVLGFDVGARRIGVAVGSAFGHGARALAVIDVHANGPDWNAIDKLRTEWRPDGLVVGDPMTLDGGDQPIRQRAHEFARTLRTRYSLPVVMVDERTSSIEAAQRFASDRAAGPQAPPRCGRARCGGRGGDRRALAGFSGRCHRNHGAAAVRFFLLPREKVPEGRMRVRCVVAASHSRQTLTPTPLPMGEGLFMPNELGNDETSR